MRFLFLLLVFPAALAFVVPARQSYHHATTTISPDSHLVWSHATTKSSKSSSKNNDNNMDTERMKQILKEEAMNVDNLKATAKELRNIRPQDIEQAIRDMENMTAAEREQMKAMGMDPEIIKQSLLMMKQNPNMANDMSKFLEKMTPEELLEASRLAQEKLASVGTTSAAPNVVDVEVEKLSAKEDGTKTDNEEEDDEEDVEEEPVPPPAPEVLDAMYKVAELMSSPPTGGVTFQAFSTLPPIALLIGTDSERDLSQREVKECWLDGSLGSTRVDRNGFERVWMEVQDYFTMELMEKARERSVQKGKKQQAATNKRGGDKPKPTSTSKPAGTTTTTTTPLVGSAIPDEVLQEQVKQMTDKDLDAMLDAMKNMSPQQVDRMKAMGADPKMMQKTAELLSSNPLMRSAARTMMKNMTPEQMKKASQQAQEQMKNMTPEDLEKAMKEMDGLKGQ